MLMSRITWKRSATILALGKYLPPARDTRSPDPYGRCARDLFPAVSPSSPPESGFTASQQDEDGVPAQIAKGRGISILAGPFPPGSASFGIQHRILCCWAARQLGSVSSRATLESSAVPLAGRILFCKHGGTRARDARASASATGTGDRRAVAGRLRWKNCSCRAGRHRWSRT
jgi:hypothetical protein